MSLFMSSARTTINSMWGRVAWAFWHNAGLKHPAEAKIVIDESMHDTPRHFAGTTLDGLEVRVAPQLAELPDDVILGVLAHEAGHVEDFRSPGMYGMSKGALRVYVRGPRHARTFEETELVADALAAVGMDEHVGYVKLPKIGWVECLGEGVKRPKGLK